jgi:hypothetical protein
MSPALRRERCLVLFSGKEQAFFFEKKKQEFFVFDAGVGASP